MEDETTLIYSSSDIDNYVMYKIYPKNINLNYCYIGHTKNFNFRKGQHKLPCFDTTHNKSHLKLYEVIRQNGGWDEWEMIEIEKINAKTKLQQEKKYKEDHKDIITEQMKKYREENKEKIYEKTKEYRENNKEKHQEWQKAWTEKNKELSKEKRKLKTAELKAEKLEQQALLEQTPEWQEKQKQIAEENEAIKKEKREKYNEERRLKRLQDKEQNEAII